MVRSIYLFVLIALLSGCVPMQIDPTRDQFGVTAGRDDASAAAVSPADQARLDQYAGQICTRGYDADAPALVPADGDRQLATMSLRCSHYDMIHFNPARVDWSNVL